MARVGKPGGTVVLTDSFQLGNHPNLDNTMGNFGNLNEHDYVDSTNDFLSPRQLAKSGPGTAVKDGPVPTKSLSFTKPT
jgi:hypothetical protein